MKKVLLFAALIAVAGCSSMEETSDNPSNDNSSIKAGGEISISVKAAPGDNEFNSNTKSLTKAGFEGSTYTSDFQFLMTQDAGAAYSYNKTMQFNSTTGKWATSDGSKLLWGDGESSVHTWSFKAYAVAPAVTTASLDAPFTFSVSTLQFNIAESQKSDLMTDSTPYIDGNGTISFTLKHRLARLRITLTGDGASSVDRLYIGGLKGSVSVDLKNNTVTTLPGTTEIGAYRESDGVFDVIVPAQTVDMMYIKAGTKGAISQKSFTLAEGNFKKITVPMTTLVDNVYSGPVYKYVSGEGLAQSYDKYTTLIFTDDKISDQSTIHTKGNKTATRVFLPNATEISDADFFNGATALKKVDAPVLKTLGIGVFQGCTALTTINMPSLETIATRCFQGTSSLGAVTLPSLISIDGTAFKSSNIQSLDATSLTTIGNEAFALANITNIVARKVTTIGDRAFTTSYSALTGTYIGKLTYADCFESVVTIGQYAFYGQPLTQSPIILLPKCTSLGNNSFSFTGITSFSANFTTLTASQFANTPTLTSINIPRLTNIEGYVIEYDNNLKTVNFGGNISGDITYNSDWAYAASVEGAELTLGNHVTGVTYNYNNVAGCWGGKTWKLIHGGVVTRDKLSQYASMGEAGRQALTEITINGYLIRDTDVTAYGGTKFATLFPNVTKIIFTGVSMNYADGLLKGNTTVKTISSSTLTDIQSANIFQNSGVTTVDLPNLVTLGSYAFAGCTGLTSIYLPAFKVNGFDNQFNGCYNLKKAYVEGSYLNATATFKGCTALTDLALGYHYPNWAGDTTLTDILAGIPSSQITLYLYNTGSAPGNVWGKVTWKAVKPLSEYVK